jgi:hypothetical protein
MDQLVVDNLAVRRQAAADAGGGNAGERPLMSARRPGIVLPALLALLALPVLLPRRPVGMPPP